MPLARMLSRSETVQNHAAHNEGLKTFLERKGDEHIFSILYLIAGILCLVASFGYGENFCTGSISTAQTPSISSATLAYRSSTIGTAQTALKEGFVREALTDNANNQTEGNENPIVGAWNKLQAAIKFPAAKGRHGPPSVDSTGSEVLQAALADLVTGNESRAQQDLTDAPAQAFLGPSGLVVLWLRVEGFTALGLPLVSILMLSIGLHEYMLVSCMLYLVAVFQAFWLVLGCVWAFGGFVPKECQSGAMGSNLAFSVLWWVCVIWLASMLLISLIILIMVCFLAGASFILQRPSGRGEYSQVGAGSKDPTDPKNAYV